MENIYTSTVWKHPQVVRTILSNIPTLDPLAVVCNSDLFYIKSGTGIAAFATRKKFLGSYELGTVYTVPEYRGHGHAQALIRAIVQSRHSTYVLCEETLVPFYKQCGFHVCTRCNRVTQIRRMLFNIFLRPFFGYRLASLRATNGTPQSYFR